MARDLSDARPVDQVDTNILSGIFTTEFWTTVGGLLANLVVVLVAIGYINSADADTLTTSVMSLIAAAQTLFVNGAIIWKYIAIRTGIKQAVLLQQMAERHDLKLTQIRLLMADAQTVPQAMKLMGMEPEDKRDAAPCPQQGCCNG